MDTDDRRHRHPWRIIDRRRDRDHGLRLAPDLVDPADSSAVDADLVAPEGDPPAVVLGLDHEDARRSDRDVVDVRPGAQDPPIVQDDPVVAEYLEGCRRLRFTASACSPRSDALERPVSITAR